MEQLNFNNIYDFCDYAVDTYEKIKNLEDLNTITFVAKYEEAREIVDFLLDFYSLRFAEFEEPDIDNYNDEFYIEISDDEVWIEKAKRGENYIRCEDAIAFIVDGCSSAIIPYIKGGLVYDVAFDVDDEDSNDCGYDCCHECDCDVRKCNLSYNDQVGEQDNAQFAKNDKKEVDNGDEKKTDTYRVNGKEVDKETYLKEMLEIKKRFYDFDEDFTDAIQRSLLFQCSYRDLMNQFLSDFQKIFF